MSIDIIRDLAKIEQKTSDLRSVNDLPPDIVDNLRRLFTEEQIADIVVNVPKGNIDRLRRKLQRAFGHYESTNILICQVERCPYRNTCPLIEIDKAPENEQCPIEEQQMTSLIDKYVDDIARRTDMEPSDMDIVMRNLIHDMAGCDLVIARCNAQMGISGSVTEARLSAFNPLTGVATYEEEPSKLLDIKIRFMKKKEDIYKQLIATPEMVARLKKKDKAIGAEEQSMHTHDVRAALKALRAQADGSGAIEISKTTETIKLNNEKSKQKPAKSITYNQLPPEPEFEDDF